MREPSKPPNGPERTAQQAVRESVDRRLREALEPPPGAAGRIARRALAEEERPARTVVVRPAVAVAGLALVAAALAALLLLSPPDRPDPVDPAAAPAGSARYSITNRGEVLVVQALDGGPSSLHSTRPLSERPPSPPGMKIIVLGGTRP